MNRIAVHISDYGYNVRVYDSNNNLFESYEAGNCSFESTTRVTLDSPSCLSRNKIIEFALQTASDMELQYNAKMDTFEYYD